jgi:hypothetical protein
MGGSDEPANLISLSVAEHAQAHLDLYNQYGKKEDLCAWYMLSGKNQDSEFVRLRAQIAGTASQKKRKDSGLTGSELFYGRPLEQGEQTFNSSKGGQIQGKRNAESGHMTRIQKMSDCSAAGKKGATTCKERGVNAFFDTSLRHEISSKGGKIQGKRNAESGHLKRISKLSKRNKGMFWMTNGIENKMITDLSEIPEGWYNGKTQKKKV